MKQSAIVIATLFSAVAAGPNTAGQEAAKARMQADIQGYVTNGTKFVNRAKQIADANKLRQTKIQNEFKEDVRENIKEGQEVHDEYVNAWKYEKSQITVTKPSAATKGWGNIHVDNPQKVMDGYVAAYKHDKELGAEWKEDVTEFVQKSHASNKIAQKQYKADWNTNGVKAKHFAESAIENAQQMRPQSLASQEEIRNDVKNFVDSVGNAAQAVENTARTQHRLDAPADRRMDVATQKFWEEKQKINAGYKKAIEFEIKNTHFNAGKPGGEGSLNWTNKQQIVNNWKAPIVADKKAREQWMNVMKKNMEEKKKVHEMVNAEAKKVWPAKFKAVETSWAELAENFNQQHSLASRADVKADLDNMANAGYNVDKVVIDDVVEFHNDTAAQRQKFKGEVGTFVEQQKKIHQAYDEAFNYEMDNIHFNNNNGKWSFVVNNKETIIDKWTDAQTDDIMSRQDLKEDFIRYQRSIAAEKAQFKATAKATWPKAFEGFKASLKNFHETMHPHSMMSAQEKSLDMKVRQQIVNQMNERQEFKFEVEKDLKAYMENTNGARDQLKAEAAQWKAGNQRVNDMWVAAWNYQIAQVKFTPATATQAGHFDLENNEEITNRWSAVDQAADDNRAKVWGEILNFKNQTSGARATLKKEIKTQWVPSAERIHAGDQQIGEEVVGFWSNKMNQHMNQTHNLMSVESSSTMSLDEQLAYGSVFLCAMIAVAALSNKGKAESKTVEFDVEDLEMTNKKESKKAIKKTLKQIMKTSNTKVAIMKN